MRDSCCHPKGVPNSVACSRYQKLTRPGSRLTTFTDVIVEPTPPVVYAACMANNVVGAANGNHGIAFVTEDNADISTAEGVSNATECCERCQNISECGGFSYSDGLGCGIYSPSSGTCSGMTQYGPGYYTDSSTDEFSGSTVGNGNCGQLQNNGDIGD